MAACMAGLYITVPSGPRWSQDLLWVMCLLVPLLMGQAAGQWLHRIDEARLPSSRSSYCSTVAIVVIQCKAMTDVYNSGASLNLVGLW